MDASDLERRTGWTLRHLAETASTNDVAAELARAGAPARTAVVADRQTAGRGRKGRRFASPAGGLYVSLLLEADAPMLPAGIVALVALAAAEALDAEAGVTTAIKWPNDLWIDRRKVGGILLERGAPDGPVVAGLGINLRAVPGDLPDDARAAAGAVDAMAPAPVARDALLGRLLERVDAWTVRCREAAGRAALAAGWRARLALVGEEVVCMHAGIPLTGVLLDASLASGLLIREAGMEPVWRRGEHVQDLRASPRTIS